MYKVKTKSLGSCDQTPIDLVLLQLIQKNQTMVLILCSIQNEIWNHDNVGKKFR
jgi:hypothetical protein